MASRPIYQFYAELNDYEPKMWRRFRVMDNISMARLGYVLMTLFEMRASHLFRLTYMTQENVEQIAKAVGVPIEDVVKMDQVWHFEIQNDELFPGDGREQFFPAAEHKLSSILSQPGEKLLFEYDFGDGWTIDVKLEDIFEDKALPGRELPHVIGGEGYGIIEDCGGTAGLASIAEAFRAREGKDYEHYSEWLGTAELDIYHFDLDDMNMRIKKLPRIFTELYEYGNAPSKRSLDLLMRNT